MFQVLVRLDNCEFDIVACRDELKEALDLIEGLKTHWPREYVVRDSEGNDIGLTRYTTIGLERGTASAIR